MMKLTEENILNVLKGVRDPDLHRDIVTLGFVKNLKISGSDVSFTLELTTPACPVRDRFREECEQAIRGNIEGIRNVSVDITSNVTTHAGAQRDSILPGVKNTVAVASGKGGVGKSTVAVNLAVALAMDGAKVGLVDADVYGPSAPMMFGITERPKISQQKLLPLEKHGVKVMSIGFLVDPMQAVIWRGPMASGAVKQFLSDVLWGELDYLIFDLPPGTGDIQLTLVQTIPLTGAVIVTTPQEVAVADVRRCIAFCHSVSLPVVGIVENMSGLLCPKCGERIDLFKTGGGKALAAELNAPFLGSVPLDPQIVRLGDAGKPFVDTQAQGSAGQAFADIVRAILARQEQESVTTAVNHRA